MQTPFDETSRASPSVNIGPLQDNVNGAPELEHSVADRTVASASGWNAAPEVSLTPDPTQPPTVPGSGLLGIWRLGDRMHVGQRSSHWLAQPADARGNTRWEYVVRTLPSSGADREAAREGLRRFAAAAERARGPHLISVADVMLDGNEPFLVMPRLFGRSLMDWLAATNRTPLGVGLWWARQAALAAATLHRVGIAHHDLRPENLWIAPNGSLTLLDLGSARSSQLPPADGTEFQTGEQADVAAIGRLLWQLLAHASDDPAVRSGQFEPVADLIAAALAPDRSQPTAAELVERLAGLEREFLGAHIRPERQRGASEPLRRAA